MTTELDALVAAGAVKAAAGDGADMCAPSNVDSARLEAYARRAVAAFVPSLAAQVRLTLRPALSPRP